jgi:hypothetical protein
MNTDDADAATDLQRQVTELTEMVRELQSKLAEREPTPALNTMSPTPAPVVEAESSRRHLLRSAALVAGGAVAASVVSNGLPAAAAPQTFFIGQSNSVGLRTTAIYNPPPAGAGGNAFQFQVGNGFADGVSSEPAALAVFTDQSNNSNGIFALSRANGGVGVIANSTGTGSYGIRTSGIRAHMMWDPLGKPAPERTDDDFHAAGEMICDEDASLWFCVDGGMPGTWVQLAGKKMIPGPTPSTLLPQFHPVTPGRVYDSRSPKPAHGPIDPSAHRTVSVADQRSIDSGEVTTPNFVPVGATAITANVTVVNTKGAGFIVVNPGGNVSIGASTSNWFADNQTLANGVSLTLNALRELTIVAGGGGGTDFIIDVSGYYL